MKNTLGKQIELCFPKEVPWVEIGMWYEDISIWKD